MSAPVSAPPPAPAFLDFRSLDWARVRRTRLYAFQRFRYTYPAPAYDLAQRLVVRPRELGEAQRLLDFRLDVAPRGAQRSVREDPFGNAVVELDIARARRECRFDVTFLVERRAGSAPPAVSPAEADLYRRPTSLTAPDDRLRAEAEALRRAAASPLDLAERVSAFVGGSMRYASGVTGVHTTAAEAFALGAGLCQDYAHVALALCRAAGLPARYVSGHMLGEGGSHAWLEALVPDGRGVTRAVGLDPTNARPPDLGYVTVAVGADYADVAPTTGLFRSARAGTLHYEKRAGLVEVEFADGARLSPPEKLI